MKDSKYSWLNSFTALVQTTLFLFQLNFNTLFYKKQNNNYQ